ncbi:hypothetical protein BGZ74_003595, partial [Mortierella antarctica]
MKYSFLITALFAIAHAAPIITNAGKPIAGSYIVVLKDSSTATGFESIFRGIAERQSRRGGRKPSITRKYGSFPGMAVTVDAAALKEISASDQVAYVEQDAVMTILGSQPSPPSWGLTRVSQRRLQLSEPYTYNDAAGRGVTAYVIDTGVYVEHLEFGGRASWGANFIAGSPNTDEHGHGTHVAGTIGSGSLSGVIAGMDWVAARAVPGKSVVNMSLGGSMSKALNDAARRLFAKNIPLIVAAGNSATTPACAQSPAGAPNTYTVAASDRNDRTASFTSYGWCVEIFAPGVGIMSSWIGSPYATNTISGTSMAAPHVTGVAALYLSFNSIPTAQGIFDKLTQTATRGAIKGSLKGSPNRLVFNG